MRPREAAKRVLDLIQIKVASDTSSSVDTGSGPDAASLIASLQQKVADLSRGTLSAG